MGRPKKKPEYDSEQVMRKLMEAIVEVYTSSGEVVGWKNGFRHNSKGGPGGTVSLRQVAEEFGITLLKARKLLITAGVFSTETSEWVGELHTEGKPVSEIMEITGLGRASVYSYFPYERGAYMGKEISVNAESAQRYRLRKNAVQKIAEVSCSGDVDEWKRRIWDGLDAFQGYLFYTLEGMKFRYEIHGGEIVVDREEKTISEKKVDFMLRKLKNGQFEEEMTMREETFESRYLVPVFVRMGVLV